MLHDSNGSGGSPGFWQRWNIGPKRLLTAIFAHGSGENDGRRITARVAKQAVSLSNDGICVADLGQAAAPLVYVNKAFEKITGYSVHEAVGKNCRYLQGNDRLQPAIAQLRDALIRRQPMHVTLRNYRKDGTMFWNDLRLVPVRGRRGKWTHAVGIIRDVTPYVDASSRLASADHLDRLTGVANRNRFYDLLEQLRQQAGEEYILLVKVDIRQFHDINVSFGYEVGDALLIQVAHRLSELVGAVSGRLSGDEFAVALQVPSLVAAGSAVSHLQTLLEPKFALAGATIGVRFSIGYTIGKAGDMTIALLRNAGIALHEAKLSKQRQPREFDGNVAAMVENRARLTADLQHAIENKEFLLYYQPKVELTTGTIIGAEALLRWNNPIFGIQPPGRFIPIAEESGLIIDLGAWALRSAAAFAVQVNAGRTHPLEISVNVSPVQFRDHDLPSIVRTVLHETGVQASWLKLELTENLLVDHSPAMLAMLQELRDMGVGLSIDDFGTGYSSLNYLEAFPIGEIKIDRSFVHQVDSNRSRRVIVEAMVRLGNELQISVIAEGAETEAEVATLRALGCPYVQGYFFGRPVPEAEFLALVHEHSGNADANHPPDFTYTEDSSRTAILVEDDPLVRTVLSDTLGQLGWAVVEVSNAEAALALPKSLVPEILITDVNLGAGLNGFELWSLARYRWPSIGIVVISGRPPSSRQIESLGLNEIFLQKPVRLPVLEAAIARVSERNFEDNGQSSAARNQTLGESGTA